MVWYLATGAACFAALVLASSVRIRALRTALRGDALVYDPLEAGFVANRLEALIIVRRAALVLFALCAIGSFVA